MVERDAWNEERNVAVRELLRTRAGLVLHPDSPRLTPRSDLFYRPAAFA